ncbi:MAG TPA: NnrU family protein [Thermoanaerobaculia bacterium]|nr:NnrU family protein [Thermoanaerobaculia bacterium]
MKVSLATAAFAVLHSVLASSRVKDAVAARFACGRRIHRVLYNGQAVLTFGALVWAIGRQPKRTIYHVTGAGAAVMRLLQTSGIGFAAAAARATGVMTLAGLDTTTPVPAAQGPEAGEDGALRIRGPFRIVRHPLNLAPLAPFWFTPHMTTRRLAFNIVATAYLVIGSVHEEQRLLRQYGEAYARYQREGVPFFLPSIRLR